MATTRAATASLALSLLLPAGALAATMQNLELRQETGENLVARYVYQCFCTTEEFHSVPLPGPGWERNAPAGSGRLFLPDSSVSTPPTPPPGVPTSLDLIPDVPGDEHVFVAHVLSGTLLGFHNQGPVVLAQVARDTTFTFLDGRVIHVITSPTGEDHVLFSVSELFATAGDLDVVGSLAPLELPAGWTYSSEQLSSDRTYVVQNGIAEVVAFAGVGATFQRVFVPEPGAAALLFAAVVASFAARRRR